jgi:CheY-like chemotaxis protein
LVEGEMKAPPELRAGLRILVVDDHPDSAEIFAIMLRRLGHEVETACDGRAALERATSFKPEIAFLDIMLPGMDGYEVSRRIRDLSLPTRLVALSGHSPDFLGDPGSFDDHLMKPLNMESLRSMLDRWTPRLAG